MQGSHLKSILIIILISPSEGKTEIGDYIVDCSACNSVPVQGISSYSCKIRCDLQGEVLLQISLVWNQACDVETHNQHCLNRSMWVGHVDLINIYAFCFKSGEVNPNLTSLYDMVAQMFDRQTSLEAELAKTKQEKWKQNRNWWKQKRNWKRQNENWTRRLRSWKSVTNINGKCLLMKPIYFDKIWQWSASVNIISLPCLMFAQ